MSIFYKNVYINDKYSLMCNDKYNPIVLKNVDKFKKDYYLNEKCIELAEMKMQKITFDGLIKKNNLKNNDISLSISGDLQNQILASTLSSSNNNVSFLGVYSACASFVEGLIIGSLYVNQTKDNVVVSSSSHNLVSEKQFRFPVEYGSIKKKCNTLTLTASISAFLSNKKSNIKVISSTIGSVCETNHSDTNDMGSAMAISACNTLIKHLSDIKKESDYYDLIITGDLGIYGLEILKKTYNYLTNKELNNIIDAGSIMYEDECIYAGASGPVCLPIIFFDYILPMKKYNKILLIGTGSLHSVLSSNLKHAIPSISHAISLEVKY